ncbi:MAG: beta-ketoacyl-ACP synthase II [Pseudomonadota bacterium]
MRRAVITGLAAVTPLGKNADISWRRLVRGDSAAREITRFDASALPCRIACEAPRADEPGLSDIGFNADDWLSAKEQRRVDSFIVYGIAAAEMAFANSGIEFKNDDERKRAGIMVGAGIGGLPEIERSVLTCHNRGARKVSPFFITASLINLVSGQVSIRLGLKGPNHAAVTACSSGAHAIGDAARMIALDDADIMIAGGAEAAICEIGIAGFAACKALSTHFNETPERASRPYDRDRDGFVMGEGAGMVVIEEYEHAKARGAHIYGEIVGYGLSGDAHHVTAPADDGGGAKRAMRMALKRSGLNPSEIGYVNAHGTSTPVGDEIELRAVEEVFGEAADGLIMSSTKSAIGHLLGAAGAVEAVFCLLAMRDGVAPPTINLENPSVDTPINLAPNTAIETEINAVMSNSFGFGGTNASLAIRRVDG